MHTALLHRVQGDPLLDTFPVRCLTYAEAMAEKIRAALSRQEAAIRDCFDIEHAVRGAGLDVTDTALVRLLRARLAVPGTGALNVSPERLDDLRQQLDAHLRPVLRPREFDLFDVDRAYGIIRGVAERLSETPA